MYLILRILKFGYLRVPPIQIPTKKGKNLSLVTQISPQNKADGFFGNYNGVQKTGNIFRICKFDILRVPCIQIATKKGKNLSLVKPISPWNKANGTFGNYNGVQKPGKYSEFENLTSLGYPHTNCN
jgi:hypothetical protein